MVEKLAKIQHEIWVHWMTYLFSISVQNEDGTVTIPADKVARWKRQINSKFGNLSEEEQKSDIEQALKIVKVIETQSPILVCAIRQTPVKIICSRR
jgi:hypothetical protein